MTVVPVMDLLNGAVVRGVGGRRRDYLPIKSLLTSNIDPAAILDAIVDRFGFPSVYIADLDGLSFGRANLDCLSELLRRPLEFIVDAGVKTAEQAQAIADLGADQIVAASESLSSPNALSGIVERLGVGRTVFSIDLKKGRPVVSASAWVDLNAEEIIDRVSDFGVRRVILLDLADVGEGQGMSTLPLMQRLRENYPSHWFAVGGGVRNQADLDEAERAGANALLIASALHDGRYPFV